MKRLFARVVAIAVLSTLAGLLILSHFSQGPRKKNTKLDNTKTDNRKLDNIKSDHVQLDKHGRIPARQRIEMRLEEVGETGGVTGTTLEYPSWWKEAWSRSEVSSLMDRFVGDRPLFPACPHKRTTAQASLYGFVETRQFLPNSKNPCWYETTTKGRLFKCAPYFYLAGVAKGGTTDMFVRIRLHPDVMQGTMKEYHWWDRYRFGNTEGDEEMGPRREATPFDEYLQQITGPELKVVENEILNTGQSTKVFGDGSPSYLWDIANWYLLDGNQGCNEPRVVIGQHIRRFYPDAKIIMTFRHPTQRLYSRFLSRIPRSPQLKGATAEDFHRYVVRGVKLYTDCFKRYSVRCCAYNDTLHIEAVVRLMEGMYPVFLADWFRIWPRKQNLILRYDDYAKDMKTSLTAIFQFLGLAKLKTSELTQIVDHGFANIGKMYDTVGPMLPKTEAILNKFYEPFILQFSEILGDQRFLWTDVKPL